MTNAAINAPRIAQLGKYRIEAMLGEGAMGIVYRAFDPHIERQVAIKTVRHELFESGERASLIARLRNEAQAAGRLAHPNIVGVYD
ncbi:MAG: protein kinase domain-containing protein, partial [Trinickia sp.]